MTKRIPDAYGCVDCLAVHTKRVAIACDRLGITLAAFLGAYHAVHEEEGDG